MAGVGVRLNRCFEKKSIATDIVGIGYSVDGFHTADRGSALSEPRIIFLYNNVCSDFFASGGLAV